MNQDRFDHLLARYLSGEATQDERSELDQQVASSPEHQRILSETETLWTASTPPVVRVAPPKEQAWQDLKDRLGLVPEPDRSENPLALQPPTTPFRLRIMLAAAAVLVLVLGGLFLHQRQDNDTGTIPWQKITTANGQRLHIVLPDSSIVRLNAATTLSFPQVFDGATRLAHLEGEAFFEVKTDAVHPFVVRTSHSTIRVTGTAFNIWARHDETRVMVREGRVVLQASEALTDAGVTITADRMSIHHASMVPEPPQSVDIDYRLGWLNGALVFEQTPLSEIVDELQRYYDVPIVLTDSTLEIRHLTAAFKDQPLETVLSAICMTTDTRYMHEKEIYRITP